MNEVGKYTVEVSSISVAHRKALKNKKIEYRGNPDDLGMEVQLLAYKLLDRYPPDHLTRKKEVQVKVQSVSAAKSNTDAMKKSLMFSGGGQLYIGRKTSAFAFMGLEAFMVLMAINSQASFKKYENERKDLAELYRQATTPDDINRYRSEIISTDSKMNSANSNVNLFLGGFFAIWAANVIHAYVMEPVLPDYSTKPIGLAYDPSDARNKTNLEDGHLIKRYLLFILSFLILGCGNDPEPLDDILDNPLDENSGTIDYITPAYIFSPNYYSVDQGKSFTVSLFAMGVENLVGASVMVEYDPTLYYPLTESTLVSLQLVLEAHSQCFLPLSTPIR